MTAATAGLKLAAGLILPVDAVTQKLALLGRTGSGKTYAATKLAELMLGAEAQIVALDPVGVWWGLRLDANGTDRGLPIPVFGGLHGDVPLEPTAGVLLADLIADRGISAVLDVSQMLSSEQARFARDFATRFFQRKKAAPSAVHLFLEECQEFVPQNIGGRGDEAHMLHAFERLIKLGRNFGIGASLISQRPQEVNKKALNQTECLFAFQMTGKHERKAIAAWATEKGLELDLDALLPHLPVGQPHVWSPQWLMVSKTVHILAKRTFDASSTPVVGTVAVEVRPLAPIDLERIKTAMAATIERAKADDPRELRKRIRALEQIHTAVAAAAPPEVRLERVEVPVLTATDLHQLEEAADRAFEAATAAGHAYAAARELQAAVMQTLDTARGLAAQRPSLVPRAAPRRPMPAAAAPTLRASSPAIGGLNVGPRKILTAIAQRTDGVTREQLTVLSGYKRSSRDAYLQKLGAIGLIDHRGDIIHATGAGMATLGPAFEPLPTGDDLRDYWLQRLPIGERNILEAVVAAWPEAISPEAISATTGYKRSSRDAYLQKLRARRLVMRTTAGEVQATAELFG